MFNYKHLSWLLDDSYITRRRVVDGVLQESLLDQVLVTNIDATRDLQTVSPLGKSDHVGILFEIKCSNNVETVTRTRPSWGKFDANDIAALGKTVNWSYSTDNLSVEHMWHELESKMATISSQVPISSTNCFPNGSVVAKAPWDCTALKRKRREKDKCCGVFHKIINKNNNKNVLNLVYINIYCIYNNDKTLRFTFTKPD